MLAELCVAYGWSNEEFHAQRVCFWKMVSWLCQKPLEEIVPRYDFEPKGEAAILFEMKMQVRLLREVQEDREMEILERIMTDVGMISCCEFIGFLIQLRTGSGKAGLELRERAMRLVKYKSRKDLASGIVGVLQES